MDGTGNVAGLIVAAGDSGLGNSVAPMLQLENISVIKRIVLTFQQADIHPIVVVTGHQANEIEQNLSKYGIIFLRNEYYDRTDKFTSVKIGMDYLQGKCVRMVYTPVTIPLCSPQTLKRLSRLKRKVVIPSYHGREGLPVILDESVLQTLLLYEGTGGLNGALKQLRCKIYHPDVEETDIVLQTDEIENREQLLQYQNEYLLHPFVRISVEKEASFFDARTALLLQLIEETHSVKGACRHMALSTGKAWNMINVLEQELGYTVVLRRQGGKRGGTTSLSLEGKKFLEKYQQYAADVKQYARKRFYEIYEEYDKV